jgi:hypothetical protein
MRFEGRELKPYAEPVSAGELKEGGVFFFVNFIDEEMLLPSMEPMVFVGRDLEPGDVGQVYFQDLDSYRQGFRYDRTSEEHPTTFYTGSENELGHIFDFDRALDVLLACSLRRQRMG